MAEDYLTDDEQLDAVKRWMGEYAPVLIIGALLGAGGYFGYQYYQRHKNEQALQASARFSQMAGALEANDTGKSRQLAADLIKDFPSSPYADQAQLALARIDVDGGHEADAITPLTKVMNDSKDTELRQIARLRIARILIDEGKSDEAISLLSQGTPGTFAGAYHDVKGDALLAKKDQAGAIHEYQTALEAGNAAGADTALLELKLADLGAAPGPSLSLNKVQP